MSREAMPLVSVIVPVYNGEVYLEQCVKSILEQSYSRVQLVLVNDGSQDNSGALCDGFAREDPRVLVAHQENRGAAAARKNGILHSQGEFLMFVDCDDWIREDLITSLLTPALEHEADMVVGMLELVSAQGRMHWDHRLAPGCYGEAEMATVIHPQMMSSEPFFGCGVHPSMCCKLFRRAVAEKNLDGLDTGIRFGEDACFVFSTLLDCRRIYIADVLGYCYRDNETSVTHRFNPQLLADAGKIRAFFTDLARRKNWDPGTQLDEYMAEIYYNVLRNAFTSEEDYSPEVLRMLRSYRREILPKGFWQLEKVRKAPASVKLRYLLVRYGSIPLVRKLMKRKKKR